MRWLLAVLALIMLALPTQIVSASEDTVQVVAVPYTGGGIVDFTATVVSDTQVDLEWSVLEGTANVMVRAKYGEMPISRTDGYLVYEGSGASVSDTSMNFDETTSILYYRIWAQTGEGAWLDSEVNTQETEGIAVLLLTLSILGLALTISGYAMHRGSLAMASILVWLGVSVWAFAESGGEWNIYMILGFVGIVMSLTSAIEAIFLNRGEEQAEDEVQYTKAIDEAFADMDTKLKNMHEKRTRGL